MIRARCLALLILCAFLPSALSASTVSGMISRVTDGDTFRLVGVEQAIRIWGLDAPEKNEIGGSRATETMRHLVEGQMVTCEVVDFDRYGRIVGQCFLPDGTDVAGEMIRLGVAREYCRYSRGYYRTC